MNFSGQNFPLSVIVHKLLTFSSPTRSLNQFQWHLAQIIFRWRENEEPQILERNTENTWTFHLISSSRTTGPISINFKFVQMWSHTLIQGDTPTTFRNLLPCKQSIFISRVILSLKGNIENIRNFSVQCCPMASWFQKEVGNSSKLKSESNVVHYLQTFSQILNSSTLPIEIFFTVISAILVYIFISAYRLLIPVCYHSLFLPLCNIHSHTQIHHTQHRIGSALEFKVGIGRY